MQFDRHTLVMLCFGPSARAHRRGGRRAPGPASRLPRRSARPRLSRRRRAAVDQDDERLRSIAIMACDPETARGLSNEFPAVQAGRLAVEVMTWMVPTGNVRFEKVPAPRSTAEAEGD